MPRPLRRVGVCLYTSRVWFGDGDGVDDTTEFELWQFSFDTVIGEIVTAHPYVWWSPGDGACLLLTQVPQSGRRSGPRVRAYGGRGLATLQPIGSWLGTEISTAQHVNTETWLVSTFGPWDRTIPRPYKAQPSRILRTDSYSVT